MAESLGIGVIGGLSALIDVTIAGTQWLRDIKNCPSTVLELANELSTFSQTVEALREAGPQNLIIEEQLTKAKELLSEIAKLLERHFDRDTQRRGQLKSRIRWAVKDKEVATKLRERLGAVRANLVLLLSNETL